MLCGSTSGEPGFRTLATNPRNCGRTFQGVAGDQPRNGGRRRQTLARPFAFSTPSHMTSTSHAQTNGNYHTNHAHLFRNMRKAYTNHTNHVTNHIQTIINYCTNHINNMCWKLFNNHHPNSMVCMVCIICFNGLYMVCTMVCMVCM